jgi:adenylylsulfate kinase
MTGIVVWLTGAPSAGKSTLAKNVATALRARSVPTVLLDGDEVRHALSPRPGYDDEGRAHFYESLAGLSALIARQGQIVLVAATAHRRAYRERARELAPRFVEVYVDVLEAERRARDDKGLYRKEATGAVSQLPGADLAYEPPSAPDLVAKGGRDAEAEQTLVALVESLLGAS